MTITDVNLRDETAGLEYCLNCDLENGLLIGWTVTCINPLPLQSAINTPFLNRQAMAQSPCQQAAQQQQQPKRVTRVRIGEDGTPVERR